MLKHLPLLLLLVGCNLYSNNQNTDKLDTQEQHLFQDDSANTNKVPRNSRLTALDTVFLIEDPEVNYWVLREYYNQVVMNQDEFFNSMFIDPYESYRKYTNQGIEDESNFSSEFGLDAYLAYYSYFLRKQYDSERYNSERKRLVDIYKSIVQFYSTMVMGGSGFAHQRCRLHGEVEWELYQYDKRPISDRNMSKAISPEDFDDYKLFNEEVLQKAYNAKRWSHMPEREKLGRLNELEMLLDNLYPKITNDFELRYAINLQSEYNSFLLAD